MMWATYSVSMYVNVFFPVFTVGWQLMLQDIIIVLEECNLLQYYIWCGALIGVKYYNWEGNYTVLDSML